MRIHTDSIDEVRAAIFDAAMARITYSRERLVRRYEEFGTIDVPDELLEDGRESELDDYVDMHHDAEHEDHVLIEPDDEDLVVTIRRED